MDSAARQEYLQKIRTVEQLVKNNGKDPELSNSGGVSSMPLYPGSAPVIKSKDSTYIIPAVKKWPERIELPKANRGDYNAMSIEYAQPNILDNDIFVTLDLKKFDCHPPSDGRIERLRRDFMFYLEELGSLVCPKLGLTKLFISSTFRTTAQQAWLYRNETNKVPYSSHMSATAADIAAIGDSRYLIADQAFYMGFGGIAVGQDFVHVDIGPKDYWNYGSVPIYYSPDKKYG